MITLTFLRVLTIIITTILIYNINKIFNKVL